MSDVAWVAASCGAAWLALAAATWAVAWADAPWWGILIAVAITGMFGPTPRTGPAALDHDAQVAWAQAGALAAREDA